MGCCNRQRKKNLAKEDSNELSAESRAIPSWRRGSARWAKKVKEFDEEHPKIENNPTDKRGTPTDTSEDEGNNS